MALGVKNPPASARDVGLIPGSGRSAEEDMATHSSILAQGIPGTEEPGRLQSMGCVRHDSNDLACTRETGEQGPTVQREELHSMSCNNVQRKRI